MLSKAIVATAVYLTAATWASAGVEEDRLSAIFIEWYIANCGMEGMPAMYSMMAAMFINGAQASDLEAPRQKVKDAIAERYPDKPAACADLKDHFNKVASGGGQ